MKKTYHLCISSNNEVMFRESLTAQRKKSVDFAGSRDAPRSFFAVETSKVSGKHLNLSENKNTSVAYSAINGQGVFNLSRGNKIPPYRCLA